MTRTTKVAVALVLLCAVATHASRLALEEDFASSDFIGRGLLQRTLNCKSVHPACDTCRNVRLPGTRTSTLICSACITGWRLRRDGISKTCDCAPGLYKDSEGNCSPCPIGQYCLGGSAANPNSTASNCPDGLATTFLGAKSQQQCFTKPGYGRSAVRGTNGAVTLQADVCPIGTYNVGKNTAGCQKCPAGLTTADNTTTVASDCLAPAGSYVDKGIGKLCPKGTFSTDLNSASACAACPTGITTAQEGSKLATDCMLAMRGYYMDSATSAQPCPPNTYNDGETLQFGAQCFDCPNGWRTKLPGADGQALCLAPAGFELVAGNSVITECVVGSYKADWNRNNCTVCGTGLITANSGSVSKDACLVPVGYGITQLSPDLIAALCTANTYGSDHTRPASAAARCTTCAPNTFTLDTLTNTPATAGYTGETDCLVKPGWGLTSGGLAEQCPKGTWNDGNNRKQCTACDAGYTTLNVGSTNATDCVIQPGWYLQATVNGSRPAPCDIGTWSTGGDSANREPTTCTECSPGFSTQTDESISSDDCKVCKAGYGGNGCNQCTYNTFSYGGQAQDVDCTPCAAHSVSRRRSTEAAMCYSETQDTVRDVFSTDATWTNDNSTTAASCSAACVSTTGCMTYRFGGPSSQTLACDLLLADASGTQQLYFKLNNGADYVKYIIGGTVTFGVQVSAPAVSDAASCMAACTKTGDCEVASFVTGACTLRNSELDSEYSGMWVVRGAAIVSDAGLYYISGFDCSATRGVSDLISSPQL